jgi:hypothetical protein
MSYEKHQVRAAHEEDEDDVRRGDNDDDKDNDKDKDDYSVPNPHGDDPKPAHRPRVEP